jgi:hypothetical protein
MNSLLNSVLSQKNPVDILTSYSRFIYALVSQLVSFVQVFALQCCIYSQYHVTEGKAQFTHAR